MSPNYFLTHCDDYVSILDAFESSKDVDNMKEFCELLSVSMTIHKGHPEKYITI